MAYSYDLFISSLELFTFPWFPVWEALPLIANCQKGLKAFRGVSVKLFRLTVSSGKCPIVPSASFQGFKKQRVGNVLKFNTLWKSRFSKKSLFQKRAVVHITETTVVHKSLRARSLSQSQQLQKKEPTTLICTFSKSIKQNTLVASFRWLQGNSIN